MANENNVSIKYEIFHYIGFIHFRTQIMVYIFEHKGKHKLFLLVVLLPFIANSRLKTILSEKETVSPFKSDVRNFRVPSLSEDGRKILKFSINL